MSTRPRYGEQTGNYKMDSSWEYLVVPSIPPIPPINSVCSYRGTSFSNSSMLPKTILLTIHTVIISCFIAWVLCLHFLILVISDYENSEINDGSEFFTLINQFPLGLVLSHQKTGCLSGIHHVAYQIIHSFLLGYFRDWVDNSQSRTMPSPPTTLQPT